MENEGALLEAINRHSDLIAKQIRQQQDWRIPLRNGVLAGLGGVIGATLIASIIVWTLQPFKGIGPLKPTLDRMTEALEKSNKSSR